MTFTRLVSFATPVRVAFLGSLLLSLVAILTNPVLNRDGILYVETARSFSQGGVSAAFNSFNWPFLSILMAVVSKLTGVGLETTGQLLNALFMAGACCLVVACTNNKTPEAGWAVCLTVLALPGLNHYREELLREYGCWFFLMLAFWVALKWSENPRWETALLAQAILCIAALFRPEALVFLAALFMWQAFGESKGNKLLRVLMIGGIPLAATLVALASVGAGHFDLGGRLGGIAGYFNLTKKQLVFDLKVQALAAALRPPGNVEAKTILLMGSLALIPIKFIGQLGLFVIALLYPAARGTLPGIISRNQLLAWAVLADLFVLSAFIINTQFLAGRYVAVLSLLAAPTIALGLQQIIERFPSTKTVVFGLLAVLAVCNVITFGSTKTHFIRAGEWLAANKTYNPRVYVESSRTAYYAGWKPERIHLPKERQRISENARHGQYDFLVLEISHRESGLDLWLDNNNLLVEQRFRNAQNDSVVIAKNKQAP